MAIDLQAKQDNPFLRGIKWLDQNIEKIFLIVGMLGIIFLMTYQVFYRYFIVNFTDGTGGAKWAEELARFLFVWISYIAVPVAIKSRELIRVDILYDRLPKRLQDISWIIVDLCMLAFSSVVFIRGLAHIQQLLTYTQKTAIMQVNYAIPYLILPIGFALILVRLLQDLYQQVKVTGVKNGLIGVVLAAALTSPLLLGFQLDASLWLFGYFAIFLLLGVPIAIALGLSGVVTILGAQTLPISYVAQLSFTSIDNVPIMAIPFFIAAGTFMGAGGLSKRLFILADELLGSLYGGLALATVATCVLFGAMSGSGPATVAAIGALTIPAMVERGYDKKFAAAIVACAGAIGVMIPPSNPFVIYGVTSNSSVGKLFMAGIVPGLLIAAVLMTLSFFVAKKHNWKGEPKERSLKTFLAAAWDSKWALLVPVIILGGIYGGYMTPTEAAAVAAFYGLIVGLFIYKEINFKNLLTCLVDSCTSSSMIIILMAMATIFGNIMTIEQIPTAVADFILGFTTNKIMILLLINILLLIVGTFMEALAAIVILVPILLPIVTTIGVDPVHFGVIMVLNLAIGFVTPPVGVNLFVASGVAKIKIEQIAKAAFPMLGVMLLVLLVVTFVPALSLWLPSLMK